MLCTPCNSLNTLPENVLYVSYDVFNIVTRNTTDSLRGSRLFKSLDWVRLIILVLLNDAQFCIEYFWEAFIIDSLWFLVADLNLLERVLILLGDKQVMIQGLSRDLLFLFVLWVDIYLTVPVPFLGIVLLWSVAHSLYWVLPRSQYVHRLASLAFPFGSKVLDLAIERLV